MRHLSQNLRMMINGVCQKLTLKLKTKVMMMMRRVQLSKKARRQAKRQANMRLLSGLKKISHSSSKVDIDRD